MYDDIDVLSEAKPGISDSGIIIYLVNLFNQKLILNLLNVII